MDHETVLRTEIEEMGHPVLVVRVPAKESVDLRAVRSFIMDSLALGVLVVGQGGRFVLGIPSQTRRCGLYLGCPGGGGP